MPDALFFGEANLRAACRAHNIARGLIGDAAPVTTTEVVTTDYSRSEPWKPPSEFGFDPEEWTTYAVSVPMPREWPVEQMRAHVAQTLEDFASDIRLGTIPFRVGDEEYVGDDGAR